MSSAVAQAVVTLKPRRALPFFSQHPWVFTGAIQSVHGMPDVGDEVIVRSHQGQFIAYGLYNPASNIRVRLYSWEESQRLDDAFWRARVETAVRLRQKLFAGTSAERACRVVFSEGDHLSGLIVDRYLDSLVVQWTSAALERRREVILESLKELLAPQAIWLRTERGVKEKEALEIEDGLLFGEAPAQTEIEEHGLKFQVDFQAGQKTGFYFDQRDNRRAFARVARGARVLDLCCYTGGFSLAAAKLGDAAHVTAVDSSETALELARRNAELNGVADRIEFQCDDMFEFLDAKLETDERYDLIALDPPKLARTRGGLERAIKAYVRLNQSALRLLAPDGILLTGSCSGHVAREDFEQIIAKAGLEAGRRVQILEQRGQATDHPVATSCLETAYLKCCVCRVD